MFTQETIVDIHVLHRQGNGIRAIANELGVSHNTRASLPSRPHSNTTLPRACPTPHKARAVQDLYEPSHRSRQTLLDTATVLLEKIRVQDYAGGSTRLCMYATQIKSAQTEPVVRFETTPGKQMPVDFTTI